MFTLSARGGRVGLGYLFLLLLLKVSFYMRTRGHPIVLRGRLRVVEGRPSGKSTLGFLYRCCLGGKSCSGAVACTRVVGGMTSGAGGPLLRLCSCVCRTRTRVVDKQRGVTGGGLGLSLRLTAGLGGSSALYSICNDLKLCSTGVRASCCHTVQ